MKIYVASHCRWAALHVAGVLSAAGHEISSRWNWEPFNPTESYSDADKTRIAKEDADDVESADALVLVSGPDKYTGGKFVEVGIAMGLRKPIVVIGRRENMLIWHPSVKTTDDPRRVDELLRAQWV